MTKGRANPFRVLIVDDNRYVGQSLESSISWKSLGVEVCAVATSALEARALLEEQRPDIVMTDIRMPEMSGLELASLARASSPRVQVIIFTAYDEFAYAQEAVRVGAVDLILKPLQNRDIEAALRRAVGNLRRSGGGRHDERDIRVRLSETLIDARRKLVIDMVSGYAASERAAQTKALAVEYPIRRYQLILGITAVPLRSASRFYERISRGLQDENESRNAHAVGVIVDGRPVCIIDVKRQRTETERSQFVRECVDRFRDAVGGIDLRVAVSGVHSQLTSMKAAYAEAQLMAARFFVDPAARIAYYDAQAEPPSRDEAAIQTKVEALFNALSPAARNLPEETDSVGGLVEALFSEVGSWWCLGLPNLQRIITQIYDRFGIRAQRSNVTYWREAPGLCWSTLAEAKEEFLRFVRVRQARTKYGNEIQDRHMRRMIEYIHHNYAQDIGLKAAADDLHLSAGYVSRLARRITGKTFTELLVETRIERAKELLRMTDAKVYQVADLVGMNNYAYFFQVFRKTTGMSPNDFRTSADPNVDNIPNKRSSF